ncbi:MAG: dockerin type I repeat-containing protein [Candidatus Zixiibacteriota bacterium]|nr:MAG: dockerin type I repeat-containing protein [candidate division Zixibacteria bacterium]
MKRNLLLWITMVVSFLAWAAAVGAQCPEEPNDHGICDTMYLEVYDCDRLFTGDSRQVRVPVRVTNDIPDTVTDSIAGMVIPLCFTSSNPGAQCFLDPMNNFTGLWHCSHEICIFRHLPSIDDPQERNWMMDLWEKLLGLEWDTRILSLSEGNNFWLALVPTGTQDQRFCGGSGVLVATMTFTVDDTMTICLDSCFWPPAGRLAFSRSDAVTYVPRSNLPYCFSMSYPDTGDCNADCVVDIGDLVYLINYLFRDGPTPNPLQTGDVNCDGIVDLGDAVFLIGYLYKGANAPGCP